MVPPLCFMSLFLSQAFDHRIPRRGAPAHRRDERTQKREYRQQQRNRQYGKPVGEEPEQRRTAHADHRPDRDAQHQTDRERKTGVVQSLKHQHTPQLSVRHADGLQDGELMPPRQDAGQHGVDEVEYADQRNDAAQHAAKRQKHRAETVKLRLIGRFALVVK